MNLDMDVKAASLPVEKEILDFVRRHFGSRWTEQVQRMLIEDNGVVLIVQISVSWFLLLSETKCRQSSIRANGSKERLWQRF